MDPPLVKTANRRRPWTTRIYPFKSWTTAKVETASNSKSNKAFGWGNCQNWPSTATLALPTSISEWFDQIIQWNKTILLAAGDKVSTHFSATINSQADATGSPICSFRREIFVLALIIHRCSLWLTSIEKTKRLQSVYKASIAINRKMISIFIYCHVLLVEVEQSQIWLVG
eukprot:scaffold6097_cov77-Cylindrotheca_fusiformis.AAC.1